MWDPLERALNARGIQTIAYDASGTGDSPPRLVPAPDARPRPPGRPPARRARPSPTPTSSACRSAVPSRRSWPSPHPHRVRRLVLASTTCGIGGVPGNPLALSLLATPLRYYSPTFLRLTANVLYGPPRQRRPRSPRHQIAARRARPPTLWGYVGQLVAAAGWTSLPWLHRIHTPTLVLSGRRRRDRAAGQRPHPRPPHPRRRARDRARRRPPAAHGPRRAPGEIGSPASSARTRRLSSRHNRVAEPRRRRPKPDGSDLVGSSHASHRVTDAHVGHLASLPDRRAAADPDGACLDDDRMTLTNREFLDRVEATAELLARHGVRPGDVVATVLTNRIELVSVMFATWRLGAALTPVNPSLDGRRGRVPDPRRRGSRRSSTRTILIWTSATPTASPCRRSPPDRPRTRPRRPPTLCPTPRRWRC